MAVAYSQNGVIVRSKKDGVTIPDLSVEDYAFKNFFPLKQYSSPIMIDENLVYNGNSIAPYNPLIINPEFKPTLADNFEMHITFLKVDGYSTSGRCLIGSYSDYYNNFTIETQSNYAWCGIPTGASTWVKYIRLDYDTNLLSNKWYSLNVRQESSGSTATLTFELSDETGILNSTTTTDYTIMSNLAQLQLGGTARSSSIHWSGNIDLKRTYISINGAILWGCNMPYNGLLI